MQNHHSHHDNDYSGSGFIGYAALRLFVSAALIIAVLAGGIALLNYLDIAPAPPQMVVHTPQEVQSQPSAHVTAENKQTGQDEPAAADHDAVKPDKSSETETTSIEQAPEDAGAVSALASPQPHPSPPPVTTEPKTVETMPQPDEQIPHDAEPRPMDVSEKKHADASPPVATAPMVDDRHLPPVTSQQDLHTAAPTVTPQQDHHAVAPPATPQQDHHAAAPPAVPQSPGHGAEPKHSYRPQGVAFVEAMIQPIHHELNERFYGWRPNDLVNLTDNVNNFQLGVLEVTRRTAVQLAERISRTGSTDAFNPHLQNAMNWLMVKADRYWFPSPESKYRESIQELEAYKKDLSNGTASFYTRTDNLIPLLMAYEDLLGSCDENLVKREEMDSSKVSSFRTDDYFYYAKGVASAMATLLEAVHHDFAQTLDNRNGSELLHHAIETCRIAADLDPWFITNASLDGLFANHRANMAAPISHARFYIGQLIKTLST